MAIAKVKDTELYEEQGKIIFDCLNKKNGVLKLPMGAGKSLISLYLAKAIALSLKQSEIKTNGISLIVCSKSLLGEWENEILKHFKKNKIKYEIFYKDYVEDIKNFVPGEDTEMILTTYDAIRSEYMRFHTIKDKFIRKTNTMPSITYYKSPPEGEVYEKESFIFGNQFNVCFFDEVQEVSNISTGKCRACCCISSVYKWGLSGTPIKEPKPNVIFGLYTMCKLPFTDRLSDAAKYLQNKSIGDGHMKYFVSRDIQDLTYIVIPKKRIFIEKHNVSKEEGLFVNILENLFSYYYKKSEEEKDNKSKNIMTTSYFAVLIYLRQACISPLIAYKSIIKNYYLKSKEEGKERMKVKSPRKIATSPLKRPSSKVNIEEEDSHIKEKTRSKSPTKTSSKSPTKKKTSPKKKEENLLLGEDEQIDEEEDNEDEESVVIKKSNSYEEILLKIQEKVKEDGIGDYLNDDKNIKSTRFKVVMNIIKKHVDDKIVLVSTSKLALDYLYDIIREESPETKVYYLTSSMSIEERNNELNAFRKGEKGDILLFTYKLGSSGLNLQDANIIVLLDFWWNKEESEQAISRVYRQGQKREVSIYLLTANTGIENFLFQKQKEKKKLIELQMIGGYKQKKEQNIPMSKIIYEAINVNQNIELLKNNFNIKK
jgi:SNF2 family DNA or RNA helicase